MLFREIVAVYCENHAGHNTTCGQNAGKSNVTAGCARGHLLRSLSCGRGIASTKANFQCHLLLPLSKSNIFSFPYGHPVASYFSLFLETGCPGKVIMC